MFHTFAYSSSEGAMKIGGKVWSDFGGHLPLIRSFTYGHNWPPQNPLYPGEPIRYHFMFYALTGWLESLGVRIDLAINSLSIFGLFGTLVFIYLFSIRLFKQRSIGYLAILLFLLNGSLGFVHYFKEHGFSQATLRSIPAVERYTAFGPWDGSQVAAIWNLNIFTNQRHLAFAFVLALTIIYLLLTPRDRVATKLKLSVGISLLMGLLALSNQAVFACLAVFLVWFFILLPTSRFTILWSVLFALPWLVYAQSLVHFEPAVRFLPAQLWSSPAEWYLHLKNLFEVQARPGFLIEPKPFTLLQFIVYWFHNWGLHLVLAPLGLLLAPPLARKFALPILTLFFVANYWQLSPDMFNNHKLINFIHIFIVIFSSYTLVRLWSRSLFRLIPLVLLFPLTFTGFIDFFAFKNDSYLTLKDVSVDPDIQFFLKHSDPHAVVANSNWFFHPASLAGRAIFSGYTYFTWSHGYDQTKRENELISIYRAPDQATACNLLKAYGIAFLELKDNPEEYLKPNFDLWRDSFIPVYQNPTTSLRIYSTAQSCH